MGRSDEEFRHVGWRPPTGCPGRAACAPIHGQHRAVAKISSNVMPWSEPVGSSSRRFSHREKHPPPTGLRHPRASPPRTQRRGVRPLGVRTAPARRRVGAGRWATGPQRWSFAAAAAAYRHSVTPQRQPWSVRRRHNRSQRFERSTGPNRRRGEIIRDAPYGPEALSRPPTTGDVPPAEAVTTTFQHLAGDDRDAASRTSARMAAGPYQQPCGQGGAMPPLPLRARQTGFRPTPPSPASEITRPEGEASTGEVPRLGIGRMELEPPPTAEEGPPRRRPRPISRACTAMDRARTSASSTGWQCEGTCPGGVA